MATVSRETAEREIARCRASSCPRMFCIASYVNAHSRQQAYKLCFTPESYVEMMTSPYVERVVILWKSADWVNHYEKLVSNAHRRLGRQ